MKKKVGIAESGMATEEMKVARQSRRNRNTTTTANSAPSIKAAIELLYWPSVYFTVLNSGMNLTPSFSASILSISALAASKTERSEAPRARLM